MLEGLLHHKKEEKEYICALVMSEDLVDACLWEKTHDGKTTVLRTASTSYTGEWEQTIDASDKAISEIETGLPQGVELKKVVFGLFPDWLIEDRIKDIYLKKLKQLTTALSLTPLGFVDLPIAISHLLQKDEGAQQTVILVGIQSKRLTVSLFKIGKLIGSVTHERTASTPSDIEKALATFTDVEVLPSRILLYGTTADIEKIKAELLNHPWQKKANFLHFPKIETLDKNFPVKAVAVASSTEITPQPEEEIVPPTDAVITDKLSASEMSKEVTRVAQDLGFTTETAADVIATSPEKEDRDHAVANVQEVPVTKSSVKSTSTMKLPRKLPTLPKFNFKGFAFTFSVPRFSKIGLVAILVIVLLVFGGGGAAVFWFLPSAKVKLLVSPQVLDKTENITVDPKATSADPDKKILPAKEMTVEVSGTKTVPTTGKKTVGDKARGEVTVYNKTLNSKSFKKGTLLTSGKLQFTLNDDVNVASASESVGSLTYGTTKAAIMASDIGTPSNVGPATEFIFSDLPTSSYSARNEKALAGGTSRDILVVSRDDKQAAQTAGTSDLEKQAQENLKQKLTSTEKILENSQTSKTIKETYNHEIGEEGNDLTVDQTLGVTVFTYNETDFFALLDKIISANVPENFTYKKEDVHMSVESVSQEKEKSNIFKSHIKIDLLPKVETTDLTKRLAGRSLAETTTYLRSLSGVSGVEFDVRTPFGLFKNQLPSNPKRITIEVTKL